MDYDFGVMSALLESLTILCRRLVSSPIECYTTDVLEYRGVGYNSGQPAGVGCPSCLPQSDLFSGSPSTTNLSSIARQVSEIV